MTIPSAVAVNAPIGQGVLYYIDSNKKHSSITVADVFRGGPVVVFGGPAPFSGLDTEQAEQYEHAYDQLHKLGIDQVVAIYAQDAFVCEKFREEVSRSTGGNNLKYYADGDGFFIKAYDLCRDFTYQGLSVRSERWCAVVKENMVKFVQHDDYSTIDNTHVDKVIAWLKENEI